MSFTSCELKRFTILFSMAAVFLIQGCGRDSGFIANGSVSDPSNTSSVSDPSRLFERRTRHS
jgi:hypothetical protein